MSYIDSYVIPVPANRLSAYRRLARKAGKIWLEQGALEYVECLADDVAQGKYTSFPQSVQLKRNETVIISWIVFKSRKHRDKVNAKVMQHPDFTALMTPNLPFDGKRMFWGGFKPFIRFVSELS